MRKLLPLLFFCMLSNFIWAQMPKVINYQAVARNSSGEPLANQTIGVRLSVVNTLAGNTTLYSETRSVTTNTLGLFNIQFGAPGAISTSGDFNAIGWANNTSSSKALKVELDINNSGSFVDMGSQSLVSVPYAFAADQAVDAINIGGHYVDTNTPEVGQVLKWTGSSWTPQAPLTVIPVSIDLEGTAITGGNLAFQMVGNTIEVNLQAGQTISVVFAASLGMFSGIANALGVAPAYLSTNPGSVVTSFNSSNYNVLNLEERKTITVANSLRVTPAGVNGGSGTIPAGTYRIGLGVRNTSQTVINLNAGLNGFILIQ